MWYFPSGFFAIFTYTTLYPKITAKFTHISELERFGAIISLNENKASIEGIDYLKPAPVMSTDIRASASLVLASLEARGKSEVSRIYHLDRGYEGIVEKLKSLGADIQRVN